MQSNKQVLRAMVESEEVSLQASLLKKILCGSC